jgi:small-conductance mechanosensitive channel
VGVIGGRVEVNPGALGPGLMQVPSVMVEPSGLEVPGLQLDLLSIGRALILLLASFALAFMLRRRIFDVMSKRVSRDLASLISKSVAYSIVALGVMAALAQVGVNISVFLLAGGIAGIILGIASQTVASNFLAGLFLYLERPFKEGDPVSIDGVGGVIHDISIMSSRVRRWDGVVVRIPNEAVFRSRIEVYNKSLARRVEYRVPIAYWSDVDRAIKVVVEALEREPLVLAEPGPEAFVDTLGDRGPELVVRFWAPSSYWFTAKMRGLAVVKEALEREGIEIPLPSRKVFIEGGEGKPQRPGGAG